MKITVLGCGALGQLWISALQQCNHDLQAWLKIPQQWVEFQVFTPEQQHCHYRLPANSIERLQDTELLLVTLKAAQIHAALTPLLTHLSPQCAIVLMHNGLGVFEELPEISHPLLHAITTHAACRVGNKTCHTARGITRLGPLNDAAHQLNFIADTLHQALPEVTWHDDIRISAWNKLAVNAVINPLTVKYQCLNGHLTHHLKEVSLLCHELSLVLTRESIHNDPQQLFDQVVAIIHSTAANTSSMLQDIQAQRMTEIDYITGYLLKRARQYGLLLTQHSALYYLIKDKESNYATDPLSADVHRPW